MGAIGRWSFSSWDDQRNHRFPRLHNEFATGVVLGIARAAG